MEVETAAPQPNEAVDSVEQTSDNTNQGLDYATKFNELAARERKQTDFHNSNKEVIDAVKMIKSGKWEENPQKLLDLIGKKDFQELAKHFIPQGEQKPPSTEDVIEELRKKVEETSEGFNKYKTDVESKAEQEETAKNVSVYKENLKAKIEGHEGDDFQFIKGFEAHDQVYDLMNHILQEEGREIDFSEAAKTVESYLVSEYEKSQNIGSKLSKSKGMLGSEPEKAENDHVVKNTPRDNPFANSLTNKMEAQHSHTPVAPAKGMEEAKLQAAEMLKRMLEK